MIWRLDFFRTTVETALLCGSTARTFTQSIDKKLDGACSKMLRMVKIVAWWQSIKNEVLYAGLPRISTTIRERRLRFSGHCWRSKNEVVNDLVLWDRSMAKKERGRTGSHICRSAGGGHHAGSPETDRLVGLVVKASSSRAEGPGFQSRLRRDFFGVESYQWLKNLALQWLPCQAPGVIGSALGLVGAVSVYCDWVR